MPDFSPLVEPPGEVISQQPDAIVISVPANSSIAVRLRWYRWLGMESPDKQACITQDGLYVTLNTGQRRQLHVQLEVPDRHGALPALAGARHLASPT